MTKLKYLFILFSGFLFLLPLYAQSEGKYNFDKPGKWLINKNSLNEANTFEKNVKSIAEWFHVQIPIFANPKGFDLWVYFTGYWDNNYSQRPCNYGKRGELNFDFQLFLTNTKGSPKWTVEPPHWSFEINNTETGHPKSTYNWGWDNTKDPQSKEKEMNDAAGNLNDLFPIFPLEKEIAPGIRLYGGGNLVVFNPSRPSYWIPLTVREVVKIKLAYYSLKEMHLLPYLKDEIVKLSEADLNAFAYSGNEELIVLAVHPELSDKEKEDGGQIMRFNPDYWDRKLPPTSIQFLTLSYRLNEKSEIDEFIKNNSHPFYSQLICSNLPVKELISLIQKK